MPGSAAIVRRRAAIVERLSDQTELFRPFSENLFFEKGRSGALLTVSTTATGSGF